MLRSVDIPTKLITGRSDYVNEYHAWNQVYLNNKWVTIDTTVDSSLKKNKKATNMIKDSAKYRQDYQY
ncbi:Transglutaminase-like superfamily protein [compost metagenome]